MKKTLTLCLALCSAGIMNAQSTWSFGITAATAGNYSWFSGGMQQANARFHHNVFGTGSLGFSARKQLCPHWSFQTGLGFSSVGFDFAISQPYSLLNRSGQFSSNRSSSSTIFIPASIVYNTNLNCRNWRWFIGGGFSMVTIAKASGSSESVFPGDITTITMQQTFTTTGKTVAHAHLLCGIEKVYKRGGILSLGVIFNAGSTKLATSDVTYTIDGTTYNHSFTNRGNYAGVYLSYYFRPKGSKAN